MATKTASDVITHALRKMNVVAFGEAADADIYATSLAEYKTWHEEMRHKLRRVYRASMSWNYDSVPEDVFAHVASCVAGRLAETIPCSENAKGSSGAWQDLGENRIRDYISRVMPDGNRYPEMPSTRRWRYP